MFKASSMEFAWWKDLGWEKAGPGSRCVVCQFSFAVAIHPGPLCYVVCQLHSKCQQHVVELILNLWHENRKLTVAEWEPMRLNSYDRDALIPYMSDELLAQQTQFTLKNCSRISQPAGTYDEALQLYAAELVKRLKGDDHGREGTREDA